MKLIKALLNKWYAIQNRWQMHNEKLRRESALVDRVAAQCCGGELQ